MLTKFIGNIILRTSMLVIFSLFLSFALSVSLGASMSCTGLLGFFLFMLIATGDADVGDKRWLVTTMGKAPDFLDKIERASAATLMSSIYFLQSWFLILFLLTMIGFLLLLNGR